MGTWAFPVMGTLSSQLGLQVVPGNEANGSASKHVPVYLINKDDIKGHLH